MKFSLNELPTAAFAVFACVMLYGGLTMEASFSGSNQHRWVPVGMSAFILVLALAAMILSRRRGAGGDPIADIAPCEFFALVLPMLLLMGAYAQGQIWFGYVPATFVIGVCVFALFGNDLRRCLVHSAIATTLLYLVFFKGLKLYNPPGTWADLPMPF